VNQELSRCTLLIVEDEPDLREVYVEILSSIGCQILQATDGADALRQLETNEVHAVLSDISMPSMTGLELLQEVRARFGLLPFVIVSAFGNKENAVEALRLGANDFIEKPFVPAEVIAVITSALEVGLSLKGFEEEIARSFKGDGGDPEKFERYRRARMPLLVCRRQIELLSKKGK
jgi:CheY-like chemotaxis protein